MRYYRVITSNRPERLNSSAMHAIGSHVLRYFLEAECRHKHVAPENPDGRGASDFASWAGIFSTGSTLPGQFRISSVTVERRSKPLVRSYEICRMPVIGA